MPTNVVHCTYSAILSERIAAHFTLATGKPHSVRKVGKSYQIVKGPEAMPTNELNPQPTLRSDVIHVLQTYRGAPWRYADHPTMGGVRIDPWRMYQRRAKTVFPLPARDFRWTS